MRTALIDADVLVYAAALSAETEIQWDESLFTLHSELKDAIVHLDNAVVRIKENLECDEVVMCLSDYNDPWRMKVMPSYKRHRKKLGMRKPLCFKPLREYIHEVYRTYQRQGLEADDVLGILLTSSKPIEGQKVLVSIDKDMMTLPGLHLNYGKVPLEGEWWPYIVEVSQDSADYTHMMQSLTGDATDGYPGCPGMGPVSAKKLLDSTPRAEWWSAIVKAYDKKGLSEEVALQNARVARICRVDDYDFQRKEVKLWTPRS